MTLYIKITSKDVKDVRFTKKTTQFSVCHKIKYGRFTIYQKKKVTSIKSISNKVVTTCISNPPTIYPEAKRSLNLYILPKEDLNHPDFFRKAKAKHSYGFNSLILLPSLRRNIGMFHPNLLPTGINFQYNSKEIEEIFACKSFICAQPTTVIVPKNGQSIRRASPSWNANRFSEQKPIQIEKQWKANMNKDGAIKVNCSALLPLVSTVSICIFVYVSKTCIEEEPLDTQNIQSVNKQDVNKWRWPTQCNPAWATHNIQCL